jgi:signal transduction histidine kinase
VRHLAQGAPPAVPYTDLQAALNETLEQQTATSEILRVIASSPMDVQPVLDAIARRAVELCGAYFANVFLVEAGLVHWRADHNVPPDGAALMRSAYPVATSADEVIPTILRAQRTLAVEDAQRRIGAESPDSSRIQRMRAIGIRSWIGVPLVRQANAIGLLAVARREVRPFSASQISLLQTFADQAVIAIENVRLFQELQQKNKALTQAHSQITEALDQQTATSEILGVISRSPTDVQPIFDAIVQSASRLCGGEYAIVTRYDGRLLHLAALHNPRPGTADETAAFFPQLPRREESATARALVEADVVHIADVDADEWGPSVRERRRRLRLRAIVAVPMLHEGRPVGVIAVSRETPGPFSDREIALLKTFADQAVIAIENARLYTELEQKSRALEAASQHKSEFLANMSHELRTPLNAVIGFSEVLTERMFGELNEKQDEYLKDIHASGRHLLSLINDILDLSKIEAGRMELELADFHLPQAIENALVLVRERALRRGIALEQAIDRRLGEMRGDERKVKQVMLNLLSNAIKFTPDGGRINVRAMPRDAVVEISVSDTGVGIAPADQEAIFEEFRQVGAASKKVEGTGLGLTLSRRFIELHGGRIWVESQLGTGSTFTFTLPMRHDD